MKRTIFPGGCLFSLFLTLFFTPSAQAQYRCPYDWGWGMGPGIMAWGGPIVMIIFWIILFILLFRRLLQPGSSAAQESALDILKKRYARGEIDKEEFEAKKRDLL
jgi:putative membrane protein